MNKLPRYLTKTCSSAKPHDLVLVMMNCSLCMLIKKVLKQQPTFFILYIYLQRANRATEFKCKHILAKSPESAHKKLGANRSRIFAKTVKVDLDTVT